MDAYTPVLLVLVFALVAAGVAYYQYQRKLERQRQLRALALGQGLDFSIDDPFDTLGEPFALLRKGDGRGVENVLWGAWHGTEVRAFDYWYYEESSDSKGHRSKTYSRFDCVIALVDAHCPQLQISEENLFTRLADALAFRDIEFESEEFNRAFQVQSDDRRFASYMVDARMMEWLLTTHPYLRFEVHGPRLLCYVRRVAPDQTGELLETSAGFVAAVPRVVHDVYGEAR